MKKSHFRTILLFALLAAPYFSGAQQTMRGWEVGGWVGTSAYFGDLNTEWRLNRPHLAGGLVGRYNFNDRLAMRIGVNAAQISAYDSDSKNVFEQRRNLHFRSFIADAGASFEFNFLPYIHGHREYFFTPYLFAGPSAFYFNPQAEYDGTWQNLQELGTEGQLRGEEYNLIQFAFNYGMGFKIDLSYRWSINVELSGRKVFTDYLDDVSQVYPDAGDLRTQRGDIAVALSDRSVEPRVGEAGRQRGNGKNNDMYATLGIGILYYFGDIRCPAIVR